MKGMFFCSEMQFYHTEKEKSSRKGADFLS